MIIYHDGLKWLSPNLKLQTSICMVKYDWDEPHIFFPIELHIHVSGKLFVFVLIFGKPCYWLYQWKFRNLIYLQFMLEFQNGLTMTELHSSSIKCCLYNQKEICFLYLPGFWWYPGININWVQLIPASAAASLFQ